MLCALAIANYRSLRDLVLPLGRLNVVAGPNGSGKSNLYRALRLLAETAQGRVIPSLAREGGFPSTLWAGPEMHSRAVARGDHPVQGTPRKRAVSLRLGFAGELRATGDVLIDQLVQMQRTGFSSAVLKEGVDAADAKRQFERFAAFYQGDAVHPAPHFATAS